MRFDEGSKFAGYTVVSRLGRGGMATVYLVREPGLARLVALKVLPEQMVDDERFAALFEKEARTVAGLDHPNIIPLFRYGIDEDVPWMALRYVDGGDLSARLAARPLATAEGLTILRSVAAALDYAHRKGVIHRDLKPQNILLTEDGAAYLADFGIAKLLEGTSAHSGSRVIGTPTYMAPEQALGKPVGAYTDVYALGVICFQWLTGSVPFDADTPYAVLLKHVNEPPPPTAMGLLAPDVARVIDRALAKDPQERFPTAGALILALEQALQGMTMPVAAQTPPAIAPGTAVIPTPQSVPTLLVTADFSRPNSLRVWKILASLAIVLAAGIGGYAYWRTAQSTAPAIVTPAVPSIPTPPAPTAKVPSGGINEPQIPAVPTTTPPSVADKPPQTGRIVDQLALALPASGRLDLGTDANCILSVDGVVQGVLGPGTLQQVDLKPSAHHIVCFSTELATIDADLTRTVAAGGEYLVSLKLADKIAEAKKAK